MTSSVIQRFDALSASLSCMSRTSLYLSHACRVAVVLSVACLIFLYQAPSHFCCNNLLLVQRLGCFKDTSRRAIPILEGKSKLVRGNYKRRKFAIRRCAMVAVNRGNKVFSVQDGGQCFSGPRAQYTYGKYGRSNRCRNGKGGPWANDVYRVSGAFSGLLCKIFLQTTESGI